MGCRRISWHRSHVWLVVLALTQGVWLPAATADILHLNNGNTIEGIVLEEGDDRVLVQVFSGASMGFQRSEIARIEYGNPEQQQGIRARWSRVEQQRRVADDERQAHEAKLRSQGLVPYDGRWVTPEEATQLKHTALAQDQQRMVRGLTRRTSEAQQAELPPQASPLVRRTLSDGEWFQRATQHFIVYYQESSHGEVIAERTEYYLEKIGYDLGREDVAKQWKTPCKVFVIPDQDRWREISGAVGQPFELVGAFAHPQSREMFFNAMSVPYLAMVFPHELTHVVFHDYAGGQKIPLWLDEGLANFESAVIGDSNELIRQRLNEGTVPSLEEMLERRAYPTDAEERTLYYGMSTKLVEYLINTHGRKKFGEFVEQIVHRNVGFERAMRRAFRGAYRTQKELQREWMRYLVQ